MDDSMAVGRHVCPYCGKVNDMVKGVKPNMIPNDGDVGICIGCGHPFFFVVREEHLSTRRASSDEAKKLMDDDDVRKAMLAIQIINGRGDKYGEN